MPGPVSGVCRRGQGVTIFQTLSLILWNLYSSGGETGDKYVVLQSGGGCSVYNEAGEGGTSAPSRVLRNFSLTLRHLSRGERKGLGDL